MNLPVFFSCYLLFFFLSIPIHELGHLLFGLMTGYKFCSFRLLSFVWIKEDGQIVFKNSKGILLGQCLMAPPKDESKFKFVWYNLGGGVLNLLVALVMIVCLIIFTNNDILLPIFVAGSLINIIMAFMNLVPLNFGIPNDGMNVLTAAQSKEAKHGLFLHLFINSEICYGKRLKDFDAEIFSTKELANYNNYFTAWIVMLEAARLYDMKEYDKSIEQYNCLNLNKLPTYYRNAVNSEYLYYYTVHKPNFDKAREIYNNNDLKKYLKLNLPSINRVLSAYEYFVNDNKESGRAILEKTKIANEKHPNNGYKVMEEESLLELQKLY